MIRLPRLVCFFLLWISSGWLHLLSAQVGFTVTSSLCSNDTTLVTANTGTVNPTSFAWQVIPSGAVLATPNASATLISFPSAGSFTIVLEVAAGSSSYSTTQTLTVHPLPTLTLSCSPPTVCAGQDATLTAAGAVSYVWSPTVGLYFFSNSSAYLSPFSTSSYTITGTSSAGCTGSTSYTVEVNNYPHLSLTASSPSVCAGSMATLSAFGASSYTWSGSSLPAPVTSYSLATGPGTYMAVGANGVCNDTAYYEVGPAPPITLTVTASRLVICTDDSLSSIPSHLSVSGATLYTWAPYEPGRMTYSLGPSTAVMPSVTTCYTVTGYTDYCQANALVCVSISTCTALEEIGQMTPWTVFPNPASNRIFIRTENTAEDIKLSIRSITGAVLLEEERRSESLTIEGVALDDLPPGIYILFLQRGNEPPFVSRLLKE